MNKYIKYLLYLLPIVLIIYLGRKKTQINTRTKSSDELVPVEPPHSHDYAYKRAYLNPIEKKNETCRGNAYKLTCTGSCMAYHYNFPDCVYRQPKDVPLSGEDGKESETAQVIKQLKYY